MAATREPYFCPSHQKHLVGKGLVKAAIETKHKALTSEQLNGPTITAVDILVWSLSLRKQKGVEGDHDWEQALFPH